MRNKMNMKSIKRWSMVFALFSLAAFVLAACGGGGGGSSAAPGTTTATPTEKYVISGTVKSSGTALQGVTMSLISSSATTMASSAADGTYSFTGLANGSYTVVPFLAG